MIQTPLETMMQIYQITGRQAQMHSAVYEHALDGLESKKLGIEVKTKRPHIDSNSNNRRIIFAVNSRGFNIPLLDQMRMRVHVVTLPKEDSFPIATGLVLEIKYMDNLLGLDDETTHQIVRNCMNAINRTNNSLENPYAFVSADFNPYLSDRKITDALARTKESILPIFAHRHTPLIPSLTR